MKIRNITVIKAMGVVVVVLLLKRTILVNVFFIKKNDAHSSFEVIAKIMRFVFLRKTVSPNYI
jgi:hypothetical protein